MKLSTPWTFTGSVSRTSTTLSPTKRQFGAHYQPVAFNFGYIDFKSSKQFGKSLGSNIRPASTSINVFVASSTRGVGFGKSVHTLVCMDIIKKLVYCFMYPKFQIQ